MDDINTIYYNTFGIAFQWKRCAARDFKKIQLVFRNTGLFLTLDEIELFSKNIKKSLSIYANQTRCDGCIQPVVVQAPHSSVSFALTYKELKHVEDLVDGCLFNLNFEKMIQGIFNQ